MNKVLMLLAMLVTMSATETVTIESVKINTTANHNFHNLAIYTNDFMKAACKKFKLNPVEINIKIFKNIFEYRKYCKNEVEGFTSNMEWCYYPKNKTIYGFITPEKDMQRCIRHEIFHAITDNIIMPIWISEGVAEYCESCEIKNGTLIPTMIQRDRLYAVARLSNVNFQNQLTATYNANADQFYSYEGKRYYNIAYALTLWLDGQDKLIIAMQNTQPEIVDSAKFKSFVQNNNFTN